MAKQSLSIELDKKSLKNFLNKMKNIDADSKKRIGMSVETHSWQVVREAKIKSPYETGRLSTSIDILDMRKDKLGTIVGTNVEYAPHVEYGTKAHGISVKNKKVLSDGKNIFGKKVKHPGTKAQPFLLPAFEKATNMLIEDIKTILKNIK